MHKLWACKDLNKGIVHQSQQHLDASLQEEDPSPKAVRSPQRNICGKMIHHAGHNCGQQSCSAPGSQRNEELWRIEDDCVDASPLHHTMHVRLQQQQIDNGYAMPFGNTMPTTDFLEKWPKQI